MLRPARIWLPFVLALAGASCAGEETPSDPNQPAGKVIELAGQVSAARDGAAARPLAVGAPVFADDTVTTSLDASAVILLAHNQVRWSLGSEKSLRVDRSMAWKAKADEGGSAFDDQEKMATASAGRHTDREAGDTAATAQLPAASSSEAAPLEQAPAAPPPADSYAASDSKAKQKSLQSPVPPARKESGATRGRGMVANKSGAGAGSGKGSGDSLLDQPSGGGGGGGGAASRAAAAAAPVSPDSKKSESPAAAPEPTAPTSTSKSESQPVAGTLVLGTITVKGALTAAQVTGKLASLGRGCRATASGKLTVHIDIDSKGAVSNVRLAGASSVTAPVSACLIAGARKLVFPASSGTTSVEREITIR